MTPRRALGVTVLACMLAMLLPGAAWSQQSPDPGIAVTTPSEALAAEDGVPGGVARGAADLQARASAQASRGRGDANYAPSLTREEAISIAEDDVRLRTWLANHPVTRTTAELEGKDRRWKVSFVGGPADAEVVEAEVYVGDEEGNIAEVRVGPQVAWMMATSTRWYWWASRSRRRMMLRHGRSGTQSRTGRGGPWRLPR